MRKTFAALLIAATPFGLIATTATPAQAYECTIELIDDAPINCNPCPAIQRQLDKVGLHPGECME